MRSAPRRSDSLQTSNLALAREWHPTKNGDLTAGGIAKRSKKRVWWLCRKGHSWQARVFSRDNGHGCPYCSGRRATEQNNLQILYPAIAREWHPTKNGTLGPHEVKPFSNLKRWWACSHGHEWEDYVFHRSNGSSCPYCSGKRVSKENCFATLRPDAAKEWHPTKNGRLTPTSVSLYSGKKVWWVCSRGHEWEARIFSRAKGTGRRHPSKPGRS
jgi:DNA-directed RNA polymerase subunit RPC12/RpoP